MKSAARLPLARTSDLVIRELDDETLVYDTKRDKAHCLNLAAALVWKQCDGTTTVREAVRSLQSALNVAVDEDVIWLAVKQLKALHLVDGANKPPTVARRELILKYAPAALALPIIISISAPTPAQGASCVCPACCPAFPTCCGGQLCCNNSGCIISG
jgi:hypothetical protein